MRPCWFGSVMLVCLSLLAPSASGQTLVTDLSKSRFLTWTNLRSGNLVVIERSTNLVASGWRPYFFGDGTQGFHGSQLPFSAEPIEFYRTVMQTNVPDPSLVLSLSFDNDISTGVVLDVSGHGNHGLRFGRPCCPTNWPSIASGPDGSQAAEFHYYFDGYGTYGRSGDYIGVRSSPTLMNLTQATISVWAHYYTAHMGNIANDHTSTLLNAGQEVRGAWDLGRVYSPMTQFHVWTGPSGSIQVLNFPDESPTGDSGGWHHYAVTFDRGLTIGYFDGLPFRTNATAIPALTMAGKYIGVSCWTFNGTPELDMSVDIYPNNAWINGRVDDIRIYNRVLSKDEMLAVYAAADRTRPTVPTNLTARASAPSQVELRWNLAADNARVTGYRVIRNGQIIGTATGRLYRDTGLFPDATYEYRVEAYDVGGNFSPPSEAVSASTPSAGAATEVIVDERDGPPHATGTGSWISTATLPGYFGVGNWRTGPADSNSSATLRPVLPEPAEYAVYIRYPGNRDGWPYPYQIDKAVPVDVISAAGTNTVTVNQQVNYNAWNLLGRFHFEAGTNTAVRIRTTGTTGYVLADAVRFVK